MPLTLFIAKSNAKVWRDLVCREWRTNAEGITDDRARFNTRRHCGLDDVGEEECRKSKLSWFNTQDNSAVWQVML
jgi:hypothetical protein